MEKLENIKILNDLVLKSERGDLDWEKTEFAGEFRLKNNNGEIFISKKKSGNIIFKIIGTSGDIITDEQFEYDNYKDFQMYKISNVLWVLLTEIIGNKPVDLQEILNLLDQDEE